jgi:hypothetical protein
VTRRPRSPLADPSKLTPEGIEYARALEQEAEADLERNPERRRHARAGDPDERRRKPLRPDSRRRRP